jgi:hypothetical protein
MFSAITSRIPGHHLRVRALLARGALAAPLAGDGADEAALLHRPLLDGELTPRPQPQVGELAERLVEVVADVGRGDLVGGDLVPQLLPQLARQLQILPVQLPADEVRVVHQEEGAAVEAHLVGEGLDLPGAQRFDHRGRCGGTG